MSKFTFASFLFVSTIIIIKILLLPSRLSSAFASQEQETQQAPPLDYNDEVTYDSLVGQETIKILGFGRIAQLGSLYDARSQKFTGDSVFPYDADSVVITEAPSVSEKLELITKQSDNYKLVNNLDNLTALAVQVGLIKVGGSLTFLKGDYDNPADSTRDILTWLKLMWTKEESLNFFYEHLEEAIVFDNFDKSPATHVVTGVSWGAGISAVLNFPKLETTLNDSTGVPGRPLWLRFNVSTPTSVQIYNDIPLTVTRFWRRLPQDLKTFSEVEDLMDNLPNFIQKTKGAKGKRLAFTLMPIKSFLDHFQKPLPQSSPPDTIPIDPNTIQDCLSLLDDMVRVNQLLHHLERQMTNNAVAILDTDVHKLEWLKQNFLNESKNLMNQLKLGLVQVTSGQKDDGALQALLLEYKKGQFSFDKIDQISESEFQGTWEKIKFLEFVKKSQGVKYLGKQVSPKDPLNLRETDGKSVYLFAFKNLSTVSSTDAWLENRARFFQLSSLFLDDKFYVVDCDFDSINQTTKAKICSNLTQPIIHEFQEGGLVSRDLDLWIFAKKGEVREKLLKDEIAQLKSLVGQLTRQVHQVSDGATPIGFIYIQYGNQYEPSVIWPIFRWTEVTMAYAGQFFRAVGPLSAPFGQAQGATAPRTTKVECSDRVPRPGAVNSVDLPIGGESLYVFSGRYNTYESINAGLRFYTSDDEVRPHNSAIRIWKRTP